MVLARNSLEINNTVYVFKKLLWLIFPNINNTNCYSRKNTCRMVCYNKSMEFPDNYVVHSIL